MTAERWADVAGFVGSILILAAFARQTLQRRAPDRLHNLANFGGASLLAGSLFVNYNLPALLLEITWATIALAGAVRGSPAD